MPDRDLVKILFVCSMNQSRSPTAEKIYADKPFVISRSAGTSKKARRTVNASDIKWADLILVMETNHRQRLSSDFPGETRFKIHVLGIPDDYKFMDPELVADLEAIVDPIVAAKRNAE